MNFKFRIRIMAIFALVFICTLLLLFWNSHQTLEASLKDSKDIEELLRDMDRLEQILTRERTQLEQLSKRIEMQQAELAAPVAVVGINKHPRAQIRQRSKNNPKLNQPQPISLWNEPIPVLVFACSRPDALKAHVGKLISYRSNKEQFPIIVSQDCDNRALQETIKEFGNEVIYIKHISSETARMKVPPQHKGFTMYYKIARHYRLGLNYVFGKLNHSSVVITEDDLDVAPDFFEYFLATRPLLELDKSLFCVSSWNDNGKLGLIDESAATLLYRTDFFPGLGWMMTRDLWKEIGAKWPAGFWDDFMREPEQKQNRSCIRPEISRTAMTDFGKSGASKGLFFNRHLKKILLNQQPVKFTALDLSFLLQHNYDEPFRQRIYSLPKLTITQTDELPMRRKEEVTPEYRIEYNTMDEFVSFAQAFGIMADTKAGVPRTAYFGVVTFMLRGNRLFFAPSNWTDWQGYDREFQAPSSVLDGFF